MYWENGDAAAGIAVEARPDRPSAIATKADLWVIIEVRDMMGSCLGFGFEFGCGHPHLPIWSSVRLGGSEKIFAFTEVYRPLTGH
jgi:hypothetical protein